MHSLISYFQLQADSDQFLSVQDVTISESGASGQAFSRGVEKADSTLCSMRNDEMTKNHFQQPTVPFNNTFNDFHSKNRSIVIVDSDTIKDQPLHLPVRTETQNDKPAPTYNPDNEHFSIQSILGLSQSSLQSSSVVDNNLNPTEKMSNQEFAYAFFEPAFFEPAFFEPAVPVAIINPQPVSVQHQKPNPQAEIECATEHSFHANEYQTQASAENEMDSSDNLAGLSGKKSDESYSLPIGRKRSRYQKDPTHAKRQREYRKKLRKDPAYVQRENERRRERYKNDPAYAKKIRDRERERQRKRQRELRNDPAFAERERERLRKLRERPGYAKLLRQRQKERYQNDPDFAERRREYQREKYHNNPDYAARQREYQRKRLREQRMKQTTIVKENYPVSQFTWKLR